jgi:hypothetical protein
MAVRGDTVILEAGRVVTVVDLSSGQVRSSAQQPWCADPSAVHAFGPGVLAIWGGLNCADAATTRLEGGGTRTEAAAPVDLGSGVIVELPRK